MKTQFVWLTAMGLWLSTTFSLAQSVGSAYNNVDFKLTGAEVNYNPQIDALIFEMHVAGQAGKTTPKPIGSMNGAPVLAYVFPTSLKSQDVGFSATEGVVALALTSHPDMDDTPLWDENNDGKFDNDGLVWHPHWVVLTKDERVAGGLSVKAIKSGEQVTLPKTAPGVPLFFDSPGFNVVTSGKSIRVVVPAYRVHNKVDFKFDAVTCHLQMSHADGHQHSANDKPMLGVYAVYGVLSGNLSLPYSVGKRPLATR